MSKEFIPGVGLTSSSPQNLGGDGEGENLMSPSMEQFKNRDPKNIPYWSPATKLNYDSEANQANSTLAASAQEFVPNFGGSDTGTGEALSGTGMNSAATEWVPPSNQSYPTDLATGDAGAGQMYTADSLQEQQPEVEMPVFHSAEEVEPEALVEVLIFVY